MGLELIVGGLVRTFSPRLWTTGASRSRSLTARAAAGRTVAVSPPHAVSAILIHSSGGFHLPDRGRLLPASRPNGELRGRTLSLEETAARWRTIDRCPSGPGQTHVTELSSRNTSEPGAGGTRVVSWTVFGGEHWLVTEEFDAAEEICRFARPLLTPADDRRL
ncbi:MAG: hypothetical protein ABSA93_25135 [Streptosporangiaceae bacterium]